ncbi:glycoside hydrolase family 13 protein [Dermabacteraceae bacterium P13138]
MQHWFRDAVVYQVYPRSFQDSNGDGIGDIPGIVSRLDYLATLGIDAIWLSPVYASPQDDNGYDISDYYAIDPLFGSMADMDNLIAQAHARGIKIIMDLVVNHTSDEHEWFKASRSGRGNPLRDYYIWRDPRPGCVGGTPGAEPNNWGSVFSGPAWEWDEASGQYYLHLFSRKQPDLNWENPRLRADVYRMMNFWLDKGIDGFRMDVINFISKTPGLPDGETRAGATYGDAGPHFINGPRIHEYLQEMRREVFAHRDGQYLTVGEMPGTSPADGALYTDPARGEVDMIFQFAHVDLDHGPGGKFTPARLHLPDLKRCLADWQTGVGPQGWNSLYWNNHDQPRIVSRWGDDSPEQRVASATALAGILHLHRGTPYIYQGEELGQTNTPWREMGEFRDLEIHNYVREKVGAGESEAALWPGLLPLNRDNARTPVQWDATANAGFTAPDATPWIRLTGNQADINAADQVRDPGSVFNFYRRLIALRHTEKLVVEGDYRLLAEDHPQVYAYLRTLRADGATPGEQPGETWLVAANLSGQPAEVTLAELDPAENYREELAALGGDAWRQVITNPAPLAQENPLRVDGLHLGPWQFVAWRKKH